MDQLADKRRRSKREQRMVVLAIILGVLTLLLVLSRIFSLQLWVVTVLQWVDDLGSWGILVFILLYIVFCVCAVPDLLPNLVAGMVWGAPLATVAVSIGRMLGSSISFLLMRTIASTWLQPFFEDHPRFNLIRRAVSEEGFKIIVLLRLCPVFPINFLHYTLGLTNVSLLTYMSATFLGMLPRTFLVSYFGSTGRSMADLYSGNLEEGTQPQIFAGGLVLTLLVTALLAYIAHRSIKKVTASLTEE